MIRSAVTVSLVEAARGGPFVFHGDLPAACRAAAELGFDAIELFAPAADAVRPESLRTLLADHGLRLAAVGTGAGWLLHKLTLSDPDRSVRDRAKEFVRSIVDLGGPFGAPAIVGSMQGRWTEAVAKTDALRFLGDALAELGAHARGYGVPLLYEPLNRYETNLANRLDEGVALLDAVGTEDVRLLADLFHMNVEETDPAAALRACSRRIGHVHFVDSNRQAAGRGHLDFAPLAAALGETGYDGYASAEALPLPDSATAARATIDAFRRWFPR